MGRPSLCNPPIPSAPAQASAGGSPPALTGQAPPPGRQGGPGPGQAGERTGLYTLSIMRMSGMRMQLHSCKDAREGSLGGLGCVRIVGQNTPILGYLHYFPPAWHTWTASCYNMP